MKKTRLIVTSLFLVALASTPALADAPAVHEQVATVQVMALLVAICVRSNHCVVSCRP